MSYIEHTNQSIQSGNFELSNRITCTSPFGKTDHDYVKIKDESIEELENDMNNRRQTDVKTSSTAAVNAAILKIKSELKFLCSLQVHNPDNSPTSIYNTNVLPSSSSTYTNLEPSFDLPLDDNLFQEIVDSIQTYPTLDDDWPSDFPIDQLFPSDIDMTFKELTDMSMEPNDEYFPHVEMTTDISSTPQDDTSNSSIDSASDDNERNDINRRGLKKSGGPVRKLARFGNKQVIKYSNEYHDRRVKNNEAVKKSRMKAKEKQKVTETTMSQLANENRTLNDRVDLLMKELQVLKSLYKELNQDIPASAVKALDRVNVR